MTFSLSCDCSMCRIIKENMRNNFDRIMSEEIQKMLDGEVEREVHATTCCRCKFWDSSDGDLGLCWSTGEPTGRCTDGVLDKPPVTEKLDGCVYGESRIAENKNP